MRDKLTIKLDIIFAKRDSESRDLLVQLAYTRGRK